MSRGLRWLRLAAVCAVFLVGLPLLLRGRVTAGASVLYNVLLGGTALLLLKTTGRAGGPCGGSCCGAQPLRWALPPR